MNGLIKPIVQPNYGNLILQALGAAQAAGNIQRQRQFGQRQEQIETLTGQAGTDPGALQQLAGIDPARARQIQLMRDEDQKRFERERAHTASLIENLPLQQQISTLDERIKMVGNRGGDPSNTQGLRDMLASGDPMQIARGQQVIQAARIQGERTGVLKPASTEDRTALMKNLRAAGFTPGTPEYKNAVLANVMGRQQNIEVTPEGGVKITSGRDIAGDAALTKPVVKELEQKLVRAEENISNLNRIESQFKPDYLTYLGKGQAFLSRIKSKAGQQLTSEEKQFLSGRRRFTENINRFFNQYRRDITGAAASVQELSSLKNAMFNEDLSPVEFEASFDEFKKEVLRSQRLARKILREGVRGSLQNKKSQAAKQFDNRFMSGEDDNPRTRMKELLKQGKNKAEVFRMLEMEGY